MTKKHFGHPMGVLTPVRYRGHPLPGGYRLRFAPGGRLRCFDVFDISLTLHRDA